MYHDIVERGAEDSSGFPGRAAALYKITPAVFEAHLRAIAAARMVETPTLTFDDGGESAEAAGDLLEEWGLRGVFFVTANCVGARRFLDARGMRRLRRRGHVIGSHSCTHPLRMAHCHPARIEAEWRLSKAVLEDMLGEPIEQASVPGGDYAAHVAEAAARAGYTRLFTSEPTVEVAQAGTIAVAGRYTVRRGTSPATIAGLVKGAFSPRAGQAIAWKARKVSKQLGGAQYLFVRRLILGSG